MENLTEMMLALSMIPGVGRMVMRRARQLAEPIDFTSCTALDIQHMLGVRENIAEQIRRKYDLAAARKNREEWERRGITVLVYGDEKYSEWLYEIPDAPELLYADGNFDLLTRPAFSIVGTRTPTQYGRQLARQFGRELAERGLVVVSGMARGIDAEAHTGALEARGGTIAVLGCGIDWLYPAENRQLGARIRKQGLLLSEYPPGTRPQRGFFPERNRIISGLAHGILVIEAASRSGSLITADLATEQGRDVFAVPGSIHSPKSAGCHWLIQQGAKLVQHVHDIVFEYPELALDTHVGNAEVAGAPESLSSEEAALLRMIPWESVSYEQILCRTEFSPSYLHFLLLSLQMKKQIMQLPGQAYIRVKP
ncbi:DNA processing protein [Aneurinibacillus soli]|uniref:Uncharacterized protein n=1 Tax=Aneurinibacillus soli TaxID=1500254 RepID=A0A0U4WFZ9_9BACL|nr:DNA-processing protein DprA [Aneurinibacillus soli]PYE63412.1 DNA processing protein [Aneurinibacillus soli]BAU27656.1 hypothetical protein CB4_01830 [Aneurinibacillus soli]